MMLLSVLLAASAPAVAPQQQSQAPAGNVPAQKKERKICKSDPAFTGSRIEKQICLTKTQWKQREDASASEGASN
jgi:hypothetical protein